MRDDDSTSHLSKHRLHLSGLNSSVDRSILSHEIARIFRPFGKLTEVLISDRKSLKTKNSYAFIRFDSPDSAESALKHLQGMENHSDLFREVKWAFKVRGKKIEAFHQQSTKEWNQKYDWTRRSNMIIQCHRSHVDRLVDFLTNQQSTMTQGEKADIQVIGGLHVTPSKSASLVFVNTNGTNHSKFIQWLDKIWFVRPIVHTFFPIHPRSIVRGTLNGDVVQGIFQLVEEYQKQQAQDSTPISSIRIQIFPPKQKMLLVSALEEYREKTGSSVTFSPTGASHVLGVIQVDDSLGSDVQGGLYGIGLYPQVAAPKASPKFGDGQSKADDSSVCRAQWKLDEVFQRYQHQLPLAQEDCSQVSAIDVGAAPGGWTASLAQNFPTIGTIYSVDPGQLEASIMALSNVEHWEMTIQKALPKLKERSDKTGSPIKVWVSDMCVKDTEQQVDWLLEAKKLGVVSSGLFFVLTLKVITGYSSNTFDAVTNIQKKRLEGISKDVQQLHLFTNRQSERTLVGYLT